jgi:hypothetical protein
VLLQSDLGVELFVGAALLFDQGIGFQFVDAPAVNVGQLDHVISGLINQIPDEIGGGVYISVLAEELIKL